MKYLLDSDTFIRAKNDPYPFESFPGFWRWIEQLHADSAVFSVDKIKMELLKESDHLANWARNQGASFFLKSDGAQTTQCLSTIAKWVNEHERFSSAAKNEFFGKADFVLVGHAMAGGYTVVSFERDEPNSVNIIKIPTVCRQFGVPCINLWQMIKSAPRPLKL